MKKILIIGNGFDLSMGRKTSYKDFYENDSCPKNYPAPLIEYLNEKFGYKLQSVRWFDLENELYKYYETKVIHGGELEYSPKERFVVDYIFNRKEIDVKEQFVSDNSSIISSLLLRKILVKENGVIRLLHDDFRLNRYERDSIAFNLIKSGLLKYFTEIENDNIKEDSLAVRIVKEFLKFSDNDSCIYSFNYTKIKISNMNDYIPNNRVRYVHGNCVDKNIILGTKDATFGNTYGFLQKSFDTNYAPPQFILDLMDADDITFFGHSLGDSDRQYFENFFKNITSNFDSKQRFFTFFTKDVESEKEIKHSLQQMTGNKLSILYGICNMKIIKTDDYNEKDIDEYFNRIRRKHVRGVRRIN